ncbi:amino acid adenylation domain-containing protein [Streptomyces sp. NPDC090442]|uniref:amino acid adenylation domain-containing protein n=1 Tax=Streptomyces sp. NPDC090442 TaxID=3365962 RepID=UPI0037F827E3
MHSLRQTPLTAYQRDIWAANAVLPDSPQFNCVLQERLEGEADLSRLIGSVQRILHRHEAFRLRFDEREGTPYQWADEDPLVIGVHDLSGEADPAASCALWMADSLARAIPLKRGPMVEATVLVESPTVTHLHVKAHHLVADGWTVNQLSRQILADYGQAADCLPAGSSSGYLDFVREEAGYRASVDFEQDRAFHRAELHDVVPVLFARRANSGARQRSRYSFTVDGALVDRIRAAGHSPFTYISAMLGVYLSRVHRSAEVVLGVPFLNRQSDQHKDVLGQFANTLPLRVSASGDRSVGDLLKGVSADIRRLRRHERLPLGDILRDLPASVNSRQLFDVTVSSLRYARPPAVMGIRRTTEMLAPTHDQDVLAVYIRAFDDVPDIHIDLDYAHDVFDADFSIESAAAHLSSLLAHGLDLADRPVADVPMLADAERAELIGGRCQGPEMPYSQEATIHGLFEARVARHPDQNAVLAPNGESLTYAELDARANQVARALRELGVEPGDRVAVLMERGPQMLVALYGVLKSGGAYVPVAPEYPADRIRFLLTDSRAKVVLTGPGAPDVEVAPGTPVRRLEDLARGSTAPLEPRATSRDLAYVIYTSGSTGKPKGVMVEHRSVVNRLAWMQRRYPIAGGDVLLQKTPVSFDVSVWELFWWAVDGASLALLPVGGEKDPQEILRTIHDRAVSAVHFVPSMFGPFLDLLQDSPKLAERARSLRFVFCSGEALPASRVEQFNRVFATAGQAAPKLVNLYGPTEATVDVSYFDCPADPGHPVRRVPIGRPVENTRLYVLGADDLPQPVGVPGELCIGGVQVARGYLERPELTAEKFTDDPFVTGGRLYRTGDLARWLADGTLEYLGRIDGQVKIRGNRVELGEVSDALAAAPGVRDAVVVDQRSDTRGAYLVGYYVAEDGAGTDVEAGALRAYLGRMLPEFMVPTQFVRIDRIPLTPNGKADRRALPAPDTVGGAAAREPRDATEATLVDIWSRVLERESVGIDDDYFALGGDSILMLRVRAEAEKHGLRFSLTDLVHNPTVAALAERVETGPMAEDDSLAPLGLVSGVDRARLEGAEDAFPVSRLQLGLLYHSRRHEISAVYKDVFRYTLRVAWDEGAFRQAFTRLVARHPVLRSSFDLAGFSEPLQIIHPTVDGGLEIVDQRECGVADADAEVHRHIEERRYHAYAFDRAPLYLFRVHVRPTAIELVLSFHHAILDGGSVANLVGELLQDYAHGLGLPIGPIPHTVLPSAAYYVREEQRALDDPGSRRYWQAELAGAEPVQLDAFRPHQARTATDAAHDTSGQTLVRRVELPQELGARVRGFARDNALPVKSVLFAVHALTLRLLAGTPDITSGLVTHGRPEREGAERIAGLFLNTVPLRLNTDRDTWLDVAREAFRQERASHPHRRFPLSAIQEDRGSATVIETAFNYVHFHQLTEVLRLPGLALLDFSTWEESNFVLLVNAMTDPADGRIQLKIDCDGRTFSAEQADLFARTYVAILRRMLEQPDAEVDFTFLTEAPALAGPSPDAELGVVQRFVEQAARTPDAVAVAMGERRWTYARLEAASDSVARRLLALGVPAEARIGIAMERSPETVAAIVGTMKAGAAVVPLDTGYPVERLASMIERAAPFRVVATSAHAHLVADRSVLLPAESLTEVAPTEVPLPQVAPDSTAYVLFTSGSTGQPKGVAMPHRSLANLVAWQNRVPSGAVGATTLSYAPLSFDVSFQETFSTLCSGGTLLLVSETERRDMPALLRLLDTERVERLYLPYVALQQLAEAADALDLVPSALRVLISSGEQLRVTDEIRRLCSRLPGVILENQYGPTETHVAAYHSMAGDPAAFPALPPIGRAVDGAEVHVLDSRLRPVPTGVRGEIYLGGACLAQGYEGRPDLTKERFLPHPFDAEGERLYRTGDFGFVLPSGEVVCLGRADGQVKVRGFRVEPAEVELAITSLADPFPGVREAAVVARRGEGGDVFLAAFLVGDREAVDSGGIKRKLRDRLPDYMVPTHFTWLDALPLTPSGKRDDRALCSVPLATVAGAACAAAPRDAYERVLVDVLADLLGVPLVGVHDNIFDLGGTSLTAMRLVVIVEQRFGVNVPLSEFIAAPTAAELAVRLRGGADGSVLKEFNPLVPIRPKGSRPPLFMIHPMGGNVLCYLPFAGHLPDDQPLYALQAAGADPGSEPLRSVEEIATSYLTAIRQVQPHGPYTIGGWSFGGFVAFEVARQLRSDGEEIANLVLLDTTALDAGERTQHGDDALLTWFFWELLWLERGGDSPMEIIPGDLGTLEEKFTYIARFAADTGVLPSGSSGAVVRRLFGVYEANWRATLAYRPRPVNLDLTLIRAMEPLPPVLASMHGAAGSQHRDASNGWRRMTEGRVRIVEVPGDHLTIMEEPCVGRVAREVAQLARANRTVPTRGEWTS